MYIYFEIYVFIIVYCRWLYIYIINVFLINEYFVVKINMLFLRRFRCIEYLFFLFIIFKIRLLFDILKIEILIII